MMLNFDLKNGAIFVITHFDNVTEYFIFGKIPLLPTFAVLLHTNELKIVNTKVDFIDTIISFFKTNNNFWNNYFKYPGYNPPIGKSVSLNK